MTDAQATTEGKDKPVEEQRTALDEYPELYDNPELLRSVMLPLETWSLQVMLLYNKPLSPADLLNSLLYHLYVTMPSFEEELKALTSKVSALMGWKESKIKHPALYYLANKRDFPTSIINEWREALKKEGIEMPNVRRINNAMTVLQSWNLVIERATGDDNPNLKRRRYSWALSPRFNARYGERLREYFSSVVVDPF